SFWNVLLPQDGGHIDLHSEQLDKAVEMIHFTPCHEIDIVWTPRTKSIVASLEYQLLRNHVESAYDMSMPYLPERVLRIEQEHPALVSMANLLRLTDAEFRQGGGLFGLPVA